LQYCDINNNTGFGKIGPVDILKKFCGRRHLVCIYGPGVDNPVAMITVSGGNQTWYYYYADAMGSVRLLTNASGVVVESYTYDPYGQARVMYSAGPDGKEND